MAVRRLPDTASTVPEASAFLGGAIVIVMSCPSARADSKPGAVDESTDAQARRKKEAKTWEKCRRLRQGEQSPRTLYLIKRKIAVDKASSLRWSPRPATPNENGELVKMPALVVRIETWDGRFRRVQRVFIDRGGEKAALTGGEKKAPGRPR
ncbi:MAG: hypothetical protein OXQ84_03745 [bacterium]|nr:hypothetical protein [bacterium]